MRCILLILLSLFLAQCQLFEKKAGRVSPSDIVRENQIKGLTGNRTLETVTKIRNGAHKAGVKNALILAGIAKAETFMIHCSSEWVSNPACKLDGANSNTTCNGGIVLTGQADATPEGCRPFLYREPVTAQERAACPENYRNPETNLACSDCEQGGVGMFQYDNGCWYHTVSDYKNNHGLNILELEDNVAAFVPFFVTKSLQQNAPFGTTNEAVAEYLNNVPMDLNHPEFDAWIEDVTLYYNGCRKEWGCFSQRREKYRSSYATLMACFSPQFWQNLNVKPEVLETCPVAQWKGEGASVSSSCPTLSGYWGLSAQEACTRMELDYGGAYNTCVQGTNVMLDCSQNKYVRCAIECDSTPPLGVDSYYNDRCKDDKVLSCD